MLILSGAVVGGIVLATLLAFIVPSATARAAAVVPIMMGIILAFGADKRLYPCGEKHREQRSSM
jgi:di/tricarboxylate transporter